jgi:hypothetical protein
MVCCQWRDEGCDSRATAAADTKTKLQPNKATKMVKFQQNSEPRSDIKLS